MNDLQMIFGQARFQKKYGINNAGVTLQAMESARIKPAAKSRLLWKAYKAPTTRNKMNRFTLP